MFPRISALNIDLLEGLDAEHHGIFLQCLRELELHSTALNARFAVSEKSNRRLCGFPGSIDPHVHRVLTC
jgi:hypothetical protein